MKIYFSGDNFLRFLKCGPFQNLGGCERTLRTPPGYGPAYAGFKFVCVIDLKKNLEILSDTCVYFFSVGKAC